MHKACSQHSYIMKLLRDQVLPHNLLDNVFHSLIISKIRYGLPVWGGYVSASQKKQINAVLHRFFKCCFTSILWDFDCLLHEVDSQFVTVCRIASIVLTAWHQKNPAYFTRRRNHPYELPYYNYSWSRCSFVNRLSTILFDIWLLFYIILNWYMINVRILVYLHSRFVVCT